MSRADWYFAVFVVLITAVIAYILFWERIT